MKLLKWLTLRTLLTLMTLMALMAVMKLLTLSNYTLTMRQSYISRYEQTPGSEFQPRDKSNKIDFWFMGPLWCNTNLDPET